MCSPIIRGEDLIGLNQHKNIFRKEHQIVDILIDTLMHNDNMFNAIALNTEFDYSEGKPDVVIVNKQGDIITFEAKLSKWKKAGQQAYRNTSFSHFSYVMMPTSSMNKVRKHLDYFKERNVGLVFIEEDGIIIYSEAQRCEPLRPVLTERAREHVLDEGKIIHERGGSSVNSGGDLS